MRTPRGVHTPGRRKQTQQSAAVLKLKLFTSQHAVQPKQQQQDLPAAATAAAPPAAAAAPAAAAPAAARAAYLSFCCSSGSAAIALSGVSIAARANSHAFSA